MSGYEKTHVYDLKDLNWKKKKEEEKIKLGKKEEQELTEDDIVKRRVHSLLWKDEESHRKDLEKDEDYCRNCGFYRGVILGEEDTREFARSLSIGNSTKRRARKLTLHNSFLQDKTRLQNLFSDVLKNELNDDELEQEEDEDEFNDDELEDEDEAVKIDRGEVNKNAAVKMGRENRANSLIKNVRFLKLKESEKSSSEKSSSRKSSSEKGRKIKRRLHTLESRILRYKPNIGYVTCILKPRKEVRRLLHKNIERKLQLVTDAEINAYLRFSTTPYNRHIFNPLQSPVEAEQEHPGGEAEHPSRAQEAEHPPRALSPAVMSRKREFIKRKLAMKKEQLNEIYAAATASSKTKTPRRRKLQLNGFSFSSSIDAGEAEEEEEELHPTRIQFLFRDGLDLAPPSPALAHNSHNIKQHGPQDNNPDILSSRLRTIIQPGQRFSDSPLPLRSLLPMDVMQETSRTSDNHNHNDVGSKCSFTKSISTNRA